MKTPSKRFAAVLLGVAALLAGCVATSPQAERNFGSSVRAAVAAQVADPSASANMTPVTGMDGRAAKATHRHYEATFMKPPEPQGSMTTGSAK
jgi:type IV pilus biogenesis protein CpaD/CtpE